MAESLNPSALRRLGVALRPDWSRTVAARRAAAAGLVMLAGIAAVRSDPRGDLTQIVVAAHDLTPGVTLTAEDVRLESRSAATVPDGAQTDVTAMIGATVAGPARRGEVLTDVRLLGSRLSESIAGPDARIVPLQLRDTAVLDLIRPGDVVDVLTAGDSAESRPRVLATDGVVVLVSEKPKGGGERVALVALPARSANEVATASLVAAVTVVMH
ncbi:SAF domain-containing protein [Mycobacterium sp. 141]|uniref:SAF domain-containing protein n=1 Tax=Mycobacterium sp. 141 TaxID=1120797 RepID=UPI00037D26F7|nr:SAF domain-containing protein [Mycobacterium sp. 141]